MRLALSLLVAIALLSNGPPPSWWSDNSEKIAACAGTENARVSGEVMEASDEWLSAWFKLASQLISFDHSAVVVAITSQATVENTPVRADLRIYKLKTAFLI
jgi:hypothetical protein